MFKRIYNWIIAYEKRRLIDYLEGRMADNLSLHPEDVMAAYPDGELPEHMRKYILKKFINNNKR